MADEKTPKDDLNRAAAGTSDESLSAARMDVIRKLVESVPEMTVEEGLALLGQDDYIRPSMGSIIVQSGDYRTITPPPFII